MKYLAALLCGTFFGAGLAVSGMTSTYKVLGFLDIAGAWDPSLMFVMGSAVLVTLAGFPLVLKRQRPVMADRFIMPVASAIDSKLIAGAIIFGIGWGLYGYCPGPAISALVYLQPETFLFVAAMAAGMFMAGLLPKQLQ